MLPESRRNEILAILKQRGYASVEDLAESVYVSVATMRRDLTQLEKDGIIKRVHGGASYLSREYQIQPFDLRNKSMIPEKMRIGTAAAKLLQGHDHIFIDSSSTCLCLAKAIDPKLELTVMTNSIVIAQTLSEHPGTQVELTGGNYDCRSMSIFGSQAESHIQQRYAKYCFVACTGMDAEFGFSNQTEVDVSVKRAFAKQAQQVVLLIDSSKVNRIRFYKVFDYDEIDILITDKPLSDELMKICEKHHIEVIVA